MISWAEVLRDHRILILVYRSNSLRQASQSSVSVNSGLPLEAEPSVSVSSELVLEAVSRVLVIGLFLKTSTLDNLACSSA